LRQIFFFIGAVLFARSLLSLFYYFATCLSKVCVHAAMVGIETTTLALSNDILGFFCGWISIDGSLALAIQRFRKTRLEGFRAEPLIQAMA